MICIREYKLKHNPEKSIELPDDIFEIASQIYLKTKEFLYENLSLEMLNIDTIPEYQDIAWFYSAFTAVTEMRNDNMVGYKVELSNLSEALSKYLNENRSIFFGFQSCLNKAKARHDIFNLPSKDAFNHYFGNTTSKNPSGDFIYMGDRWIPDLHDGIDEMMEKILNEREVGLFDKYTVNLVRYNNSMN